MSSRVHDTSDLWDLDDETPDLADNDSDWDSGSDSESPGTKRKRKAKSARARQALRPPEQAADQLCTLSQPDGDGEDELLDQFLAEQEQQEQQQAAKRLKRSGRSPSPLLVDVDAEDVAAAAGAGAGQGCGEEVLDPRTRAVMEQARKMQQRLVEARRIAAGEDDSEEEQEEEEQQARPAYVARVLLASRQQQQQVEDLTLDLLEDSDTDEGEPAAGGSQAADAADDGKVALNFKTRGQEDVTVRIKPQEQLRRAMERFREFVADQGWGRVKKFHGPDGDPLTGRETAAELDLEAGDIIEVFLDT